MISDASRPPSLSGTFAALATSDWYPRMAPRYRFLEEEKYQPSSDIDWQLVVSLRRQTAGQVGQASERWLTEHGTMMPEDDREAQSRAVIRTVVHIYTERLSSEGIVLWPMELETGYVKAMAQAIFGYGRLNPVLSIPETENIEITGWDSVMIQYGGRHRESHPPVTDSDRELIEAVRSLGETTSPSRPFNSAHPAMTLALDSRLRLHAIGFGLSHRPSIIIRQHTLTSVTLKELANDGMLPLPVARLLAQAVPARKSIMISGGQGAGKTTLLRTLIAEIPPNERFGTLETNYELLTRLQPGRRNILTLQTKVGPREQQGDRHVGEWSVVDLIPEALRQNLSRLVVGGVQDAEAGAMFEAMQTGTGTLSTTHSHSAASTTDCLVTRVALGRVLSVEEAMRQIAHSINFIVHVTLRDDAWRGGLKRCFISEMRQLTGAIEDNRPSTHLVYRSNPTPLFQPETAMSAELLVFRRVSWDR